MVQSVKPDERRKRVNNDRTEARELALRLDRSVAGNPKALATVRVPTAQQEQARIASGQHAQLQREAKRVASQGRRLLLSQGRPANAGSACLCALRNEWKSLTGGDPPTGRDASQP